MTVSAGTRLGPYEIVAPIGKGGMGEVWKARDTRLGRDVAIKVSSEQFSERFEREACAVAALNHPNICTLHDVRPNYLVMEYIEGATLADRIKEGPFPLEEALNIARHVADALDAAHEKNIIHRDLKPGNIKIKPDGTVKVLDFGLAKMGGTPAAGKAEDSPTLTLAATQGGMILGTAAYMSPEQARGKEVDKRSDIWSFGAVLWEMLTGKRLFEGETVPHTLADVLKSEINFGKLPKGTPAPIRELLRRCLDRDTRTRLRDIGEARVTIQKWLRNPSSETDAASENVGRVGARASRFLWPSIAAMLGVAAAVLAFLHFREVREAPRLSKTYILPSENFRFTWDSFPAVSPDGRQIALVVTPVGKRRLVQVRDLDSLVSRTLPGTEGALEPFWSPDGRSLAFFSDGKLKRIDLNGGPPLTLCDAPSTLRETWNQSNVILFPLSTRSALFRVSAEGGNPSPVTVLDQAMGEVSHRNPWFLPDGHHFFYMAAMGEAADKTTLHIRDLDSNARIQVAVAARSNAIYSPPGYLLFTRENTLMAQPFDAGKLQIRGSPVSLAEQVDYYFNRMHHQFSASQNGVLVYTSGITAKNTLQLTWFDRTGRVTGTVGSPGDIDWGEISPDGKTVAVSRRDPQTGILDLWLEDTSRGTSSRLTFGPRDNRNPVWSPDGRYIAFRNSRKGYGSVFQKAVNGSEERLLDETTSRWDKRPDDWSRDGRYIVETYLEFGKGDNIWILPILPEERKPFPYVQTPFNKEFARVSPDSRWLAYMSDETKRFEIYVSTFPKASSKWQISTNGGQSPVWSRDGKELYFIGPDQKVMAVQIKSGAEFEASIPKPLFDSHIGPLSGNAGTNNWFAVSKDGRFLIPVQIEEATSVPMTVVLNWPAGLRK